MKKRLTALLLACVMLVCMPAASTAESHESIYRDTLDRFYAYIASGAQDREPGEGETGVWEALMGMDSDTALEKIGYAFFDMNGDGVSELFIGAITHTDGTLYFGDEIYAFYTLADGAPQYVFEGWARSRYRLTDDYRFFYAGSSGASRSAFAVYSFTPNGTLACDDFFFTHEKGANGEEIGYYHNRTGEWDPAQSTELDNPDVYTIVYDQLDLQTALMPFTPFAAYDPASPAQDAPTVSARWVAAGDVQMVEFSASRTVWNFQVLSLSLDDIDANGQPAFSVTPLYTLGALTPDNPILAALTFWGDTPNNGIAYTDETGATHRFIVDISGMDGSLTLTAF